MLSTGACFCALGRFCAPEHILRPGAFFAPRGVGAPRGARGVGAGRWYFRPGLGRWGGAMRFSPRLGALGRGDEIFRPAGRGGAMHWLRTTTLIKWAKSTNFMIFAAARPPAADRPPPKPILQLGYVVRTHHFNFQQNWTTLSMVYSSYR